MASISVRVSPASSIAFISLVVASTAGCCAALSQDLRVDMSHLHWSGVICCVRLLAYFDDHAVSPFLRHLSLYSSFIVVISYYSWPSNDRIIAKKKVYGRSLPENHPVFDVFVVFHL